MNMYFSPSTKGLYAVETHGGKMPQDCQPISDELYEELRGKSIEIGPGGGPRLALPPSIADEREGLMDRVRADTREQRAPIINTLASLQVSAMMAGDTEEAQAIEACKLALLDLTKVDLTTCTSYEDCRLAVKMRYLQIAVGAPMSVRLAFKEALA